MASNLPLRPLQIKDVRKYFHDDVYVGVFAGDMNANKPLDRTLPQENGFKDAYLELGVSRVKRYRGNDMGPLGWIRCYIVVRLYLGVWKGQEWE